MLSSCHFGHSVGHPVNWDRRRLSLMIPEMYIKPGLSGHGGLPCRGNVTAFWRTEAEA